MCDMWCADSRKCEIHLITFFSIEMMNFTDPSTVINGSNTQNNSTSLSLYSTFSCSILNHFIKIISSASQPIEKYI